MKVWSIFVGVVVLVSVTACGPKTSGGVSYEVKSKSDVQSECRRALDGFASVNPSAEVRRTERAQVNPCCREVAKVVGGMSAEQRTYVWNNYLLSRDLSVPLSQREAALAIRDSIGRDMIPADRAAASLVKGISLGCMATRARQERRG